MRCPQCGIEMQPGGIVTGGITAMWHPQAEFDKTGLKRLFYKDGKPIGKSSILLEQTRIPNAYYCPFCRIVTGIFPVERTN